MSSPEAPSPHRPLAGYRIVSVERMLAAPYATQILADLGADVIKVEQPGHGDETRSVAPFVHRQSHYFISTNSSKRSIVLNLKHRDAPEVFAALVRSADTVVENLRPGRLKALGLGFEWMAALNPRLVVCSISGFGSDNEWSQRPAFDLVIQALSGLMSINGEPESGPTKIGLPLSDLSAGLWAAIAITAHLAGPRQAPVHIDLAMFDASIALPTYLTQMVLSLGQVPGLAGSHHHAVTPYGRYRAADGWVVIALQTGVFWRRFCRVVGREDLVYRSEFRTTADRLANRDSLETIVAGIIVERNVDEWEHLFITHDIPGARINSVADALESPVVAARNLVEQIDVNGFAEDTVGSPIRIPDPPETGSGGRVPELGADTIAVLQELGFDDLRIDEFEHSGLFDRPEEETR